MKRKQMDPVRQAANSAGWVTRRRRHVFPLPTGAAGAATAAKEGLHPTAATANATERAVTTSGFRRTRPRGRPPATTLAASFAA